MTRLAVEDAEIRGPQDNERLWWIDRDGQAPPRSGPPSLVVMHKDRYALARLLREADELAAELGLEEGFDRLEVETFARLGDSEDRENAEELLALLSEARVSGYESAAAEEQT